MLERQSRWHLHLKINVNQPLHAINDINKTQMHSQRCGLRFLHDNQQTTPISNFCFVLWNQGLVNLSFDDNKTRFRTNDYISSVIRQDNFQSGNHKDKLSQREIIKKNKTSKRSVFQDPSFIRSLCKVVGA